MFTLALCWLCLYCGQLFISFYIVFWRLYSCCVALSVQYQLYQFINHFKTIEFWISKIKCCRFYCDLLFDREFSRVVWLNHGNDQKLSNKTESGCGTEAQNMKKKGKKSQIYVHLTSAGAQCIPLEWERCFCCSVVRENRQTKPRQGQDGEPWHAWVTEQDKTRITDKSRSR